MLTDFEIQRHRKTRCDSDNRTRHLHAIDDKGFRHEKASVRVAIPAAGAARNRHKLSLLAQNTILRLTLGRLFGNLVPAIERDSNRLCAEIRPALQRALLFLGLRSFQLIHAARESGYKSDGKQGRVRTPSPPSVSIHWLPQPLANRGPSPHRGEHVKRQPSTSCMSPCAGP